MIILSYSYRGRLAAAEAEAARPVLPRSHHRQRLSRTCQVRYAGQRCTAHFLKAMREIQLMKGVRPKPKEAKGRSPDALDRPNLHREARVIWVSTRRASAAADSLAGKVCGRYVIHDVLARMTAPLQEFSAAHAVVFEVSPLVTQLFRT